MLDQAGCAEEGGALLSSHRLQLPPRCQPWSPPYWTGTTFPSWPMVSGGRAGGAAGWGAEWTIGRPHGMGWERAAVHTCVGDGHFAGRDGIRCDEFLQRGQSWRLTCEGGTTYIPLDLTPHLPRASLPLFLKGQTGSGKTHTMEGPESNPGVNSRALSELFRCGRGQCEKLVHMPWPYLNIFHTQLALIDALSVLCTLFVYIVILYPQ